MASETEDPTDAAARLEAALDRIAGLTHRPSKPPEPGPAEPLAAELAVRLDALIARVRTALGTR